MSLPDTPFAKPRSASARAAGVRVHRLVEAGCVMPILCQSRVGSHPFTSMSCAKSALFHPAEVQGLVPREALDLQAGECLGEL
jgi:hypothetical protein